MKVVQIITFALVLVGGLNWGLWGLFQFDLVAAILGGNDAVLARIVYTLVGLSAAFQIATVKATISNWNPRMATA
jgi:uncharacterized protein